MYLWKWVFATQHYEYKPGPGRNLFLPTDLQSVKLSLKSPEVITHLQQTSLLGNIHKIRQNLKPCPPLEKKTTFPPRHPVLKELLTKFEKKNI